MTCEQGLLRLLWGGGGEVGVLRHWLYDCFFIAIIVKLYRIFKLYSHQKQTHTKQHQNPSPQEQFRNKISNYFAGSLYCCNYPPKKYNEYEQGQDFLERFLSTLADKEQETCPKNMLIYIFVVNKCQKVAYHCNLCYMIIYMLYNQPLRTYITSNKRI